MKIPRHLISENVRRKAYQNWLARFRHARDLFADKEVDVYQIYDVAYNDERFDDYLFLLDLMSELNLNQIGPKEISTITHGNGVIEVTIDNIPLRQIYRTCFQKDCEMQIIERNLNRGQERE